MIEWRLDEAGNPAFCCYTVVGLIHRHNKIVSLSVIGSHTTQTTTAGYMKSGGEVDFHTADTIQTGVLELVILNNSVNIAATVMVGNKVLKELAADIYCWNNELCSV